MSGVFFVLEVELSFFIVFSKDGTVVIYCIPVIEDKFYLSNTIKLKSEIQQEIFWEIYLSGYGSQLKPVDKDFRCLGSLQGTGHLVFK